MMQSLIFSYHHQDSISQAAFLMALLRSAGEKVEKIKSNAEILSKPFEFYNKHSVFVTLISKKYLVDSSVDFEYIKTQRSIMGNNVIPILLEEVTVPLPDNQNLFVFQNDFDVCTDHIRYIVEYYCEPRFNNKSYIRL